MGAERLLLSVTSVTTVDVLWRGSITAAGRQRAVRHEIGHSVTDIPAPAEAEAAAHDAE